MRWAFLDGGLVSLARRFYPSGPASSITQWRAWSFPKKQRFHFDTPKTSTTVGVCAIPAPESGEGPADSAVETAEKWKKWPGKANDGALELDAHLGRRES